jgi:hypothetical protein
MMSKAIFCVVGFCSTLPTKDTGLEACWATGEGAAPSTPSPVFAWHSRFFFQELVPICLLRLSSSRILYFFLNQIKATTF